MASKKRNDKIEVVLNPEEKAQIIRDAKREGLPTSTYVRWKLLRPQEKIKK